jgi:BMFP domain-containing protein YqiC
MPQGCGIVVKTLTLSERATTMTTTSSRFFDEIAKVMNSAAGAAQGVRREIDGLVKSQVERVLNELEVVKREEFDAVKEMAGRAREENDRLLGRIAELERRLGGTAAGTAGPSPSTTPPSAAPPPFPATESSSGGAPQNRV